MDLSVWSRTEFKIPEQLPEPDTWSCFEKECSYEGNGWQIIVLMADDEPSSEVLARFPKAQKGVYVSLEPLGAGREGYRMLENVVRSLSRMSEGVWVDAFGSVFQWNEGVFQ